VLKEKCEKIETEKISLQKDKELLQSNLTSALNQIAGLESQLRAQKDRIGELKSALDSSNAKLNESIRINRDDHGKILQLQTQLEMERKQAAEKLQLIESAREQLKNEFINLASSIFEENSRKFSEQNKNSLDLLLNPLRDQLGDFRKRVEDVYTNDTRERQSLFEQIKILTDLNQQVNREAQIYPCSEGENKNRGAGGR
jgi:DNA recombination protein RmuC